MPILPCIKSPNDLKKLSIEELSVLAREIRDQIVQTCSKTGGHVAPSLGVVELTIALLRVFKPPVDRILRDVSHQTYAYKILTGRKDRMHTIRQLDGLSLFLDQECRDLAQRLALSTAFAGLFAGLPRGATLLNGQYILLRRDVYEMSGGFSAVRGEMLEDVALGHLLRSRGGRVPMMHGYDVARVRMYRSSGQMWHGLTRLGAGSLRWEGPGATWAYRAGPDPQAQAPPRGAGRQRPSSYTALGRRWPRSREDLGPVQT